MLHFKIGSVNQLLTGSFKISQPNVLGSSFGLPSVSNIESQPAEIPIIAGIFKNQKRMTQVSYMGPPRTATTSPLDTPYTVQIICLNADHCASIFRFR